MKFLVKLLVIIFLLNSFVSQAHVGKDKVSTKFIRVKVTSLTGEEIIGAKITIENSSKTFFTDAQGYVQLECKTEGSVKLEVNAIGFAPTVLDTKELSSFSEVSLNAIN
jgi:Carboxypeptidase regulatory-like domain